MRKSRALTRTGVGKWPALLVAVVLAFFGVVFVAPASNAATSDLEKSIVQVAIIWTGTVKYIDTNPADGKQYWYTSSKTTSVGTSCTGWFASSEGDIVTAGHCVDPAMDRQVSFVQQFLADNNAKLSQAQLQDAIDTWQVLNIQRAIYVTQNEVPGAVIHDWMVAKFVDYSPWVDGDVALLNATSVTNTPAIAVAAATPDQGSPVTSIGFPGNVSDVQNQLTLRASFMDGTISSHQTKKNGVPVTGVSAPISEGMSGGPTVNAQNQVVGVNSYRLTQDAPNFNFITDTVELNKFLKKNDVAAASQAVPDSSSSAVAIPGGDSPVVAAQSDDSSVGTTILGGVIVIGFLLFLVGGIAWLVFYLVRKRKKGEPVGLQDVGTPIQQRPWSPSTPGQGAQQEQPSNGLWTPPQPPPVPSPAISEVRVCTHQGETGMFCSQCGGRSTGAG